MFPIFLIIFLFLFHSFINCQRLPQLDISDQEIRQFVNEMREQSPPLDVPANFQGHTSPRDNRDQAEQRLFQNVNPTDFTRHSDSVRHLLKLYDNYDPQTGLAEFETATERSEIQQFLDVILQSVPMQRLYGLLRQKGHPIAQTEAGFRRAVEQLWFGVYSRARGAPDSSGFEHVFIGELKNGEVSGLHNWIRFLYLEQNAGRNRFDYKGFLIKRGNIFGAVKFAWLGHTKPTGSFLIGTLPEFDFALYTLCFLARRGGSRSCNFDIDGCPLAVTSFELVQQGGSFIGSMYPSAGRMTEECRAKAAAARGRTRSRR